MSRSLAKSEHFSLRRVPPISSHWRPPPKNRVTSGAYCDRHEEVSVDNWEEVELSDIKKAYCTSIKVKGVGYTFCQNKAIRERFKEKNIDGEILLDPISGNDRHAVITGKQNQKKQKQLSEIFEILIEPKSVSEVFKPKAY